MANTQRTQQISSKVRPMQHEAQHKHTGKSISLFSELEALVP